MISVSKKVKYEAPKISKLDEKETAFGGQDPGLLPCESGSNAEGACSTGGIALGCFNTGSSATQSG